MRGQFDMKKTQKWKSQFITVAIGQAISMLGSHGVQFAGQSQILCKLHLGCE